MNKYQILFGLIIFTFFFSFSFLKAQNNYSRFVLEANVDKLPAEITDKKIESVIDDNIAILKNRLELFGISDTKIQKSGSKRITVEIPGTKDADNIRRLLETTGNLTFNLVIEKDYVNGLSENIDKALEKSEPKSGSNQFTKLINYELAVGLYWLPVNVNSKKETIDLLENEEVRKIFPDDVTFAWSSKEIKTFTEKYLLLYFLKKEPELTGKVITDATFVVNPENDNPYTSVSMNSEGATEWEKFTGENVGKQCAIVFDGIVFSTPKIIDKMTGGKINITGLPSIEEAKILAILIKSGALQIQLKIISEDK
jgi:protein-export membrane protein SecD